MLTVGFFRCVREEEQIVLRTARYLEDHKIEVISVGDIRQETCQWPDKALSEELRDKRFSTPIPFMDQSKVDRSCKEETEILDAVLAGREHQIWRSCSPLQKRQPQQSQYESLDHLHLEAARSISSISRVNIVMSSYRSIASFQSELLS